MLFLFLSLAFTIIGVGITSLFAEPRFSLKKALFILSIFTIILIIFDIVLYILLERDLFMKLYPFTNHLPTLIITGYISKTRGWKLLFQFLSSVLFCFLIQHIGVGANFRLLYNVFYCSLVFYKISQTQIFKNNKLHK